LIKIVQKSLNKSIANRTITKQETVCQLAKLPLVICSEQIDIISLSKAVKVQETNTSYSTTFLSKYANRMDHLDKSLHQYFHVTKNNSLHHSKKEYIPHYVGGGGQPTYLINMNFARTEMIMHIPWHKNQSLPPITEENYTSMFNNFKKHNIIHLLYLYPSKEHKIELRITKRGLKNQRATK